MAGILLALVVIGAPASPQQVPARADGRVVRVARGDTLPVARQRVVLHHVSRDLQGPIDSALTDPRGHFAFRFKPDTAALYLISARYAGVEYFSAPVHVNPVLPDTALLLVVSDTSKSQPVALGSRHLLVSRPGKDGTRQVLDIVTLLNSGGATRVPADSQSPSWAMVLPAGVLNPEPGQSDFSAEAMVIARDTLRVFAPIAPGEKDLSISYAVPARAREFTIPLPQVTGMVFVLLEEHDARLRGSSVGSVVDTQSIQGHRFWRWTAQAPGPETLRVEFATDWLDTLALPLAVMLVAAGLGIGAWLGLRRRAMPASPVTADGLIEALARLDARYQGRQPEVSAEEWSRYQETREKLKADLAARLASPRPQA